MAGAIGCLPLSWVVILSQPIASEIAIHRHRDPLHQKSQSIAIATEVATLGTEVEVPTRNRGHDMRQRSQPIAISSQPVARSCPCYEVAIPSQDLVLITISSPTTKAER
ncbi:hypothetical protein L484_017244 [Morus notabilis]|uniref:Secreted protein n=1 Tax=Morus notabilis TaxID=981085 RepID=W9RFR9_9ROSA|nr:hypothetical protein L484_017244 [Morus notabilis]